MSKGYQQRHTISSVAGLLVNNNTPEIISAINQSAELYQSYRLHQAIIQMQNVTKQSGKSVEEYRHNIKLLKYHLKKQQKVNETLRYKESKKSKKEVAQKSIKNKPKDQIYSMLETVNELSQRLKDMGLVLGDIFRMSDSSYDGQITKEQFMKAILRLRSNLEEGPINEMFYAIDSNMNGMLSSDEYRQFLLAHGGSESKQAISFQKGAAQVFAALLRKKKTKTEDFIRTMLDPISANEMAQQLKKIGLDRNQTMILLKLWDPSLKGEIRHEVYLKSMENVKQKDEKQIENEKFQKGIQQLCVLLRDRKINPLQMFEQSESDGKDGISMLELQGGLKKILPDETTFQIKKWVSLINLDGNNQITKEEFVSSIRSFYSIQQINKFSTEYEKLHPALKKALTQEDLPAQQIIRDLSNAIEDSGHTKTEIFHKIDINHNGLIDKSELLDGLKNMGLHVGLIGKVLTVFDRDASGEVSLDEWLSILGEDVAMEEVDVDAPSPIENKPVVNKKAAKKGQSPDKQIKSTKKETKKEAKKQSQPKIAPSKEQTAKDKPDTMMKSKKQSQPKLIATSKQQIVKKLPNHELKAPQVQVQEESKVKPVAFKQPNPKTVPTPQPQPYKQPQKPKKLITKPSFAEQKQKSPQKPKLKTSGSNKSINALRESGKIPATKLPEKKPANKRFAEDLKESQVHQPEESKNDYDNDFQNDNENIDVEDLEKEVAEKYSKSKKQILTVFGKNSKKRTSVTEKELQTCLSSLQLKTSFDDKKVAYLFQNNVSSNGLFMYGQWLNSLLQKYNIQAQQKPEDLKQPSKKQQEETPDLINLKKKSLQSKVNPEAKKDSPDLINISKKKKLESKVAEEQAATPTGQQQNIFNPSAIKQTTSELQNKSARKQGEKKGENDENFQALNNLVLEDKVHTTQGYKLSNYITCDRELQLLKNKYLSTAKSLRKNKKDFQDKSFPPEYKSLTDLDPSSSKIESVSLIKWKHYRQIYKNAQLVEGKIEPNDIKQGGLGDCYFLCSLASFAEYSKLIQRLFQYYDLQCGYFLIWLCIDGHWKLYEIDGYIPVDPRSSKPMFSHGANEELWVLLLEKAYAKAYGCYEHIIGGVSYEAIKDLSGAPGQSFAHKKNDKDVIWDKLLYADKNQFIMSCGTEDNQNGAEKLDGHSENITKQGIVLGHAYSILQLGTYKNQKLIQLRNPWGQTEWKGEWSDGSKKWTAQAKQALNYNFLEEDGIFWMPFSAFIERYATTAINYIRPIYYYTSETRSTIKNLLIKIEGNTFKHGFFMVCQHDHRQEGLPANSPYSLCRLIALTYKNGKVLRKIADESYLYQRESSVEMADIEEGAEVVIMVSLEQTVQVQLCTYTDTKLQYEAQEDFDSMLVYMEGLAKIEPSAKVSAAKDFKSWMTAVGETIFYVFKNTSNKPLTINLELNKPQNIAIFPQSGKRVLKLGVGGIECIRGKILNLKNTYSFGEMSYSTS